MAEQLEVFGFAYRGFELLINAADYFALVPGAECGLADGRRLAEASEEELASVDWLTVKDKRYRACALEPLVARLTPTAPPLPSSQPDAASAALAGAAAADATDAFSAGAAFAALEADLAAAAPATEAASDTIITSAFLMRLAGAEPLAVVVTRSFELKQYDLADFRLFPRSLRARLGALGLLCLRFSATGRLQLMMYPPAAQAGWLAEEQKK